MEKVYIAKTNYFYSPLTWIKRTFEFLAALGFLYWISIVESEDMGSKYPWVKYLLFVILAIYIFCRPKDELAVDKYHLYYIRKSLLPFFTSISKYQLSQIKSIGCGGVFDPETEFLGRARATDNRLEIIFKDNTSTCHDVTIYKRELKAIVKHVQW